MKKVAMYYPWVYLKSGVERVILEIAKRSRHEITIYTNHLDLDQTFPEFKEMGNIRKLKHISVQRSFFRVLQGIFTLGSQIIDPAGYDVLVVHSEGIGDFLNFRNHSKTNLCICYTPVRPVYDPVYRQTYLSDHPRARLPLALFSFLYKWITRAAWKHYRRVFVISKEAESRIHAGRICGPEKLEILYPGVDTEAMRPGGASERFFLYAGRIKWTKNVGLAIEAFRDFRARSGGGDGWKLIIAGIVDSKSRKYFAELQALAAGSQDIVFKLDPTTPELWDLYSRCSVLLYTPLNEDWGIVPIEAMAFGKPVLAVNSGGPKETILDGKTGFLLEPTPAAFAEKMLLLSRDPGMRLELGRQGVERAKAFTWTAFVKRLDDYIDSLGA